MEKTNEEERDVLKAHMDECEKVLLATSRIPASSGHPLHKGTPRETFVKEYLERHLPSNVAIGTGEIIDSRSKPGESRNQYDVVIYKRTYPKLDFGGGVSGFLIESVIATIEVKSVLTQDEFSKAAKAAYNSKQLLPNVIQSFRTGTVPPGILNYVVAFDGPASMSTVHGWVATEYLKKGIPQPPLPTEPEKRIAQSAPALDAVFLLGKGFIYYDNTPFGFVPDNVRKAHPAFRWVFSDTPDGNLLLLFFFLQQATANLEGKWLNAIPYLENFKLENCAIVP